MGILALHKKLKTVNKLALQATAIKMQEPFILALNKEQLSSGKNAFGLEFVQKYVYQWYAQKKQTLNSRPPFGTPDLRLTGKFYNAFKAIQKKEGEGIVVSVDSTDSKKAKLVEQYGTAIFGLDKKNHSILQSNATDTFVKLWRKQVGL